MQEFVNDPMVRAWVMPVVVIAGAVVAALIVARTVSLIVRAISRRRDWPHGLIRRTRRPFRLLVLVIAVWIAVAATVQVQPMRDIVDHGLLLATIASAAWFLGGLALFFSDVGLARFRTDVADNRRARRVRTQVLIVRRVIVVVIAVIALGSMLLTFPDVSAAGASLLASAGLISIVAGLAAQSTLANVFAGMQLAFSDAIRVDDVVIVESEWGRIEEITLTYVVVQVWDDRRLVLPSTYFTTTPFQNWTRTKSELMGSVELDVDWRVDVESMRAELRRLVETTQLWDGRTAVLQVTDAVGGLVRLRVLVTAVDAPTLFDLRCHVREGLVSWVHRSNELAIPRTRVESVREPWHARIDTPEGARSGAKVDPTPTPREGVFTGGARAQERGSLFTGPVSIRDTDSVSIREDGSRRGTNSILVDDSSSGGLPTRRHSPVPMAFESADD